MKHEYKKIYKNVEIRQLVENDLESLRGWRNNPSNTLFLRPLPYITSEMQKMWYQTYLKDENEIIFAIDEISSLHKIVGSISLYNFCETNAEVGKLLIGDQNAHGKNVSFNALKAIMDIAKHQLHLDRLFLHVYKDNEIAVYIYKKVGFNIVSESFTDTGMLEYTMNIKL